jgi:hypothetical protein
MTKHRPLMRSVGRRRVLAFGGTLLSTGSIDALAAVPGAPTSNGQESLLSGLPSLIVGGPQGSQLVTWASMFGGAIGPRMQPAEQSLRIMPVGGADGVTAANQFEARAAPDGATALFVSGSAAMAWLRGDPRAQFDAGHWLPLATGLIPGVVLMHSKLSVPGSSDPRPQGAASTTKGPFRLCCSGPLDVSIAASLGLSVLGIETLPATVSDDPISELRAGRADFAFLLGAPALERLSVAGQTGVLPIFSLGMSDDAGGLLRDPMIADVPTLPELVASLPLNSSPGLLQAWRAVAAAAQIEFALVLPWLTPAGTVAIWRKAVSQMALSGKSDAPPNGSIRPAFSPMLRIHTDPAGNFGLSAIITDSNTLLELRRWAALHLP